MCAFSLLSFGPVAIPLAARPIWQRCLFLLLLLVFVTFDLNYDSFASCLFRRFLFFLETYLGSFATASCGGSGRRFGSLYFLDFILVFFFFNYLFAGDGLFGFRFLLGFCGLSVLLRRS